MDRKLGDEYVIVPIRRSLDDPAGIFQLNDVGAFIWPRLVAGDALGEIASALARAYDVSFQDAETDLLEFVAQLQQVGAIEPISIRGAKQDEPSRD